MTQKVEAQALTYDEVEQIIKATEPASMSDRGDRIWTRRMAVSLADKFNARLTALSALPEAPAVGVDWASEPKFDWNNTDGPTRQRHVKQHKEWAEDQIERLRSALLSSPPAQTTVDGDARSLLKYWSAQPGQANLAAHLKQLADIGDMLDAGQGDDEGAQILPDFEPGMSVVAKIEECLFLLEKRRDVIAAYGDERLFDDSAYMADGEVKMTAAEDVLAWLLIEKVGVPDDMNYTPKEAQDILARAIDQLHAYESAALASQPAGEGAVVTLSRMGWEEQVEGGKLFTATAVFSEPPPWSADVVWKSAPFSLSLAAKRGQGE
jgi:hypothetical protein